MAAAAQVKNFGIRTIGSAWEHLKNFGTASPAAKLKEGNQIAKVGHGLLEGVPLLNLLPSLQKRESIYGEVLKNIDTFITEQDNPYDRLPKSIREKFQDKPEKLKEELAAKLTNDQIRGETLQNFIYNGGSIMSALSSLSMFGAAFGDPQNRGTYLAEGITGIAESFSYQLLNKYSGHIEKLTGMNMQMLMPVLSIFGVRTLLSPINFILGKLFNKKNPLEALMQQNPALAQQMMINMQQQGGIPKYA